MDLSYLDLLMTQEDDISEPEGGGGIWVVADRTQGQVANVTLEALSAARSLADSLGAYVYCVLLGSEVSGLAGSLYQAGADGVRVAEDPSLAIFALEPYLEILADLFAAESPEVVMLGATDQGQELAPRLAQRMGGGLIEHVTAVALDEATRSVQCTYPVYGGEYYHIAACPEARPQFLTIEAGAFAAPYMDSYRRGEPTPLEVRPIEPTLRIIGRAEDFEPPAIPLSSAPVIVSAGRQAGDFDLVLQLSTVLGGQVAGDRGARDAGWIGPERIIDLRHVSAAPDVYLAAGIRGDTFHNAAVEEAKFIAAIHPDPVAPIFQIADICVEAEPAEVLPHLIEALQQAPA